MIKSGTDFRDLSSAELELADTPSGSIRRKVIRSLTGKHHYVLPSSPPSPMMDDMLKDLLSSVEGTLQKPVCFTLTPFDARSEVVRTRETGLGNWAADVLMHAYAESLIEGGNQDFFEKEKKENTTTPQGAASRDNNEQRKRKGGADAVIICGGTLRGDSQYGPGKITLGDILGQCFLVRCKHVADANRGLTVRRRHGLPRGESEQAVLNSAELLMIRLTGRVFGIQWNRHYPSGQLKKGKPLHSP